MCGDDGPNDDDDDDDDELVEKGSNTNGNSEILVGTDEGLD